MSSLVTLPDGRKLSYKLDDEPKGAPVVILANSLSAPFEAWIHVVAGLNNGGFRTLRYDQPGHGDSEPTNPLGSNTFDSMAEDVHVLLRKLGLTRVHGWVGVSMGAATGIYFVTKFPGVVDRLAICDTISSSPGNAGAEDAFGPRVEAARADGNMDKTIEGTLDRWFGSSWMDANPDETERMRQLMRRTSVDGFEACCAALRSSTFDVRPLLGKIASSVKEVLLIVGERDANLPQTMDEMRKDIQRGFENAGDSRKIELKVLPKAGHVSFIDNLPDFLAAILDFLGR